VVSFAFRRLVAAHAFAIASLVALCDVSFAATVVLKDGTVIKGEVVALQDGVYTIATASAGTLHVRKQEVRSIDETGAAAAKPGTDLGPDTSSPGADALDAAKSRIAEDPRLLAMVFALQNDPAVLAVLADPEIAKGIAAGDYVGLMNNPKIIALMNNEKVRAIIDETR
jgi:hypothetical protein